MKTNFPRKITHHVSRLKGYFLLTLSILLFFTFVACSSTPEETPTPGLNQNQTQAYETVAARITEVSQDLATQAALENVPTDTGLPTLTPEPKLSDTPPNPTAVESTFTPTPTTASSASDCDRAEAGLPIDVTIPDDTQFSPGASFVKTWRLVNIGTCTWTTGYALVFFSGEKMGGPDVVPLNSNVATGQVVDLSVNLTAPSSAGSYQGNWMLRNPSGVLFGIGPQGNSFFWVRIVVPGEGSTSTNTPTGSTTPDGSATSTPTPTLTPTTGAEPQVIVNSFIAFEPDAFVDLDTGVTNGGAGNDIAYTTDQSGTHPLSTQGGAVFAIFGTQTPSYENCRTANLGGGSLTAESISIGTYICYKTDQGRVGWFRVDNFDSSSFILSITLLTWE